MNEHMSHKLASLHQNLLHGKLPRSLPWSDVLDLIGHLGSVESRGDDFTFHVGTRHDVFRQPQAHELGVDEASRLRKFLKEATQPAAAAGAPRQPVKMVVVIDHHGARIFQDLNGSRPQLESTVRPYDPAGVHHHLIHRKESHFQGGRVPEENSFYEEVCQTLVSANEIVLIGHGTGKSSAVNFLGEYLKKHHAQIFARVKATETADLSALTEPEIEVIAKRHMIQVV